jgi:hypothetical protein
MQIPQRVIASLERGSRMRHSTTAGHACSGHHQSRHRHRWQRPENDRYEHQQRAWTTELTWVAALQSADEFAGTADEDPVLSTIKPTSTIVPAIIERIMVSLAVCAAPQNSAFSSVTHRSRSCRLYWHQSTVVSGVLSCIAKPADGNTR